MLASDVDEKTATWSWGLHAVTVAKRFLLSHGRFPGTEIAANYI
jgi:hypothetical protein